MIEPRIINCAQGTREWFEARLGIPTASNFSAIMTNGKGGKESKTRRTYMLKLLAERMMQEVTENHNNAHMERGHEHEPLARGAYQFKTGNIVEQVGFVRIEDAGYSPDGLIGEDGAVEIKSKLPHLHLDVVVSNEVPREHMTQIMGGLWVTGRKWCDFVSYCPRLPLFVKRVHRDEKEIEKIALAVAEFNRDLDHLHDRITAWEATQ